MEWLYFPLIFINAVLSVFEFERGRYVFGAFLAGASILSVLGWLKLII